MIPILILRSLESSRKSGTGATEADELVRDALVHKVRENIEPFLDTFFDIQPQECDAMLQKLADRSLWSLKTTSWTNLPSHPENEMSLFSPLVEIANAVAELDYAIHPRSDGAILSWIDAHNEGVDSYWSGTYDGFVDLIAELEPVTPACTSFRSRCHKSLSWNRVIIPGIIKERGISYSGVIQLQLFHCVRQMYKEQPDRRFIFGFTFEFVFLTVWYFDRTGVLGSERINVHKVSFPHSTMKFANEFSFASHLFGLFNSFWDALACTPWTLVSTQHSYGLKTNTRIYRHIEYLRGS